MSQSPRHAHRGTVHSLGTATPRVMPLRPFGAVAHGAGAELTHLPKAWLAAQLDAHKLLLLRGFMPPDREGLLAFAHLLDRNGQGLLAWDFGQVMEMRVRPDAANYLFTPERVPYHWDGAFHREPSYLVFHCLEAPALGAGGETTFCDTTRVWREAPAARQDYWRGLRVTYETEKKAHYGGRVTRALVDRHPHTGETVLRFAEAVETKKNPVSLTVEGLGEAEAADFVADMTARVYAPPFAMAHAWRDGDVLVADNHALIHGRRAFAADGPRHLRRVQVL